MYGLLYYNNPFCNGYCMLKIQCDTFYSDFETAGLKCVTLRQIDVAESAYVAWINNACFEGYHLQMYMY